jgi:hypothetical protein
MRAFTLALVTAVGIGVPACGSGNGGTGSYGSAPAGAPTPSPTMGDGTATLTVENFLNWCSVEINGGPASTDAIVTASVAAGEVGGDCRCADVMAVSERRVPLARQRAPRRLL